ncbi:MAG: recombinase family protein [Oscillospiraceae bacterium]|nr:recombinase family protein [Oscillospiraceae bacterium]
MKNVAIYCRLSDEDDDKKFETDDSGSIQNQKSMLTAYALERGWNIYDIYSDDDRRGVDFNRPDWNRLLTDAENGKFDIVLCKTQSRFTRDMEMVEKYIHTKFLEWGIRFVSIVDHADTEIKGNKKQRQINGLVNEWYLEDASDNVKKTLRHKMQNGEFVSGQPSYGYLRDPNDKYKVIVDDVAANIVREIFGLYKQGLGVISIVKHLNSRGVQTPTAHKLAMGIKCRSNYNAMWAPGTVRQILRNEIYIGHLVQGKQTTVSYKISKMKKLDKSEWARVDDNHEAIIDIETWNAVQRRIASRSRPLASSGEVHIFSQKVRCAECGAIFVRKNQQLKGDKGYVEYLYCSGVKYGNRVCSNKHALRFDKLAELVTDEINVLIDQYADEKAVLNELRVKYDTNCVIKALETELAQLNEQINKKQGYFKKLYEDKLNGRISDAQFGELNQSFKSDIDALNLRVTIIHSDLLKADELSKNQIDKRQVIEKHIRIERLDRVAVDEFVERIEVHTKANNERNIAINWTV